VPAGGTETLNLPEDGVLYAGRNGTGIIDGIGVTNNISALTITLFIDK
jgi:TM2 domain-containing membrane protein YozV